MGDRTARPAYNYENLRITIHDMAPIVRTAWIRGVSALPNVFAHESFIDELAAEAGVDPLDFRLRHMKDERAAELTRATAARAGWQRRVGTNPQSKDADILRGRGVAQALYVHDRQPPSDCAALCEPTCYHAEQLRVGYDRNEIGETDRDADNKADGDGPMLTF